MTRGADATIRLLGDTSDFKKAMRSAQGDAATFGQKMQAVGGIMKSTGRTMTLGVTMPIVAGMALAVKAAIAEEKEMALLSKAMRTNAGATQLQVNATERWITKMQNATGVADGELRPALATLVAATKNTSKAQDMLGVALDISAAKGKPVEAVALALQKAYLGNVGGLSRLGIATKDAEGKTLSFKQVMKNAIATYGGAAQTAANTTAGKMAVLKAKLADLSEAIGTQLIPFVTKIVGWLSQWAERFNNLSPGAQKLIVIIAGVVAAIGPLLMILGQIVTVAPLVGAAFTVMMGPVGLIVIGIAAVVAAFVLLWKKCDWFRNFWIAVWEKVKVVFEAVWPVIKKVMGWIGNVIVAEFRLIKKGVLAFWNWAGPFITEGAKTWWKIIKQVMAWIVSAVRVAWPIISGIVRTNINAIKAIVDGVRTIIRVIADVWRAVTSAARTAWNGITGVVKTAWNNIAGFINKILDAFNWVTTHVPGIPDTNYHLPTFGASDNAANARGDATRTAGRSVSIPSTAGVPGVPHADGGGKGGIKGSGNSIFDWMRDLWDKYGLGSRLPSPIGGLFGGMTGSIYTMVKDAIWGLLKKYGGGPGQAIIDWAKTQLGKPYLWGATGPDAYDCSGLIYRGYLTAGQSIPRSYMWNAGKQVSLANARPADVMFYNPGAVQDGVRVKYGHVKMYAGGGQTIESGTGGVHMGLATGASEIRTYLGLGGITRGLSIAGERGPEAVIPLTNPARGAAVMREAGLVGGDTYVVNMGTVYATNPRQAQAVANDIIHRLAIAKRQTARGTAP